MHTPPSRHTCVEVTNAARPTHVPSTGVGRARALWRGLGLLYVLCTVTLVVTDYMYYEIPLGDVPKGVRPTRIESIQAYDTYDTMF